MTPYLIDFLAFSACRLYLWLFLLIIKKNSGRYYCLVEEFPKKDLHMTLDYMHEMINISTRERVITEWSRSVICCFQRIYNNNDIWTKHERVCHPKKIIIIIIFYHANVIIVVINPIMTLLLITFLFMIIIIKTSTLSCLHVRVFKPSK